MRLDGLFEEHRDGDVYEARLALGGMGTDVDLGTCSTKAIGRYGEDVAALLLQEQGLEIRERNWFCAVGEVDIIAEDRNSLVLVEVKTRRVSGPADDIIPELAVDSRKLARYQRLALIYLAKQTLFDAVRFDVVALQLPNAREARVHYLQRAYEWDR